MSWMRRQWRALLLWFDGHPDWLAGITATLGMIMIILGKVADSPAELALGAVCSAGALVILVAGKAKRSSLAAGFLVVVLLAGAAAVVWAFTKIVLPPLVVAVPVGLLTAFRLGVQMRGREATMEGRPGGCYLVLNFASFVLIWTTVIAYGLVDLLG